MISRASYSSTPRFVGFVQNESRPFSVRATRTFGRGEAREAPVVCSTFIITNRGKPRIAVQRSQRMRLNKDRWTRYDVRHQKSQPNRALPLTDKRRPYRSGDRRSVTTGPVDGPVNDCRNVGEDSSEYQDVDAAWLSLNGFAVRGFRG